MKLFIPFVLVLTLFLGIAALPVASHQLSHSSLLRVQSDTVAPNLPDHPFDPQAPKERDIGQLLDYFFQINQDRTNTGLGKDIHELGTIFPNPFKEQLTLSLHEAQTETLNLRLLDMQGRLLFQDNFSGSFYQLPRNNLPAGAGDLKRTLNFKPNGFCIGA